MLAPAIQLWPLFVMLFLAVVLGVVLGLVDLRGSRPRTRAQPTELRRRTTTSEELRRTA